MSTASSALTLLSDDQKFIGENLLQWKTNITLLLGTKGLLGYINGDIPRPSPPAKASTSEASSTSPAAVAATPLYSLTPTYEEWLFRDQLTKGLVALNCSNTISLGVNTSGTAKEAWDSILAEWGTSTDMRRSHAEEALHHTEYTEGSSIQDHINLLRDRKAAVDNLSTSTLSDEAWRGVLIWSIPPTPKWLPLLPSLYSLPTSANIISTLLAHAMIDRGSSTKGSSSASGTALAAHTQKGCTNPGCKARKKTSHTTDNFYWPGGGKEGPFPPNFGQKAKANATAAATPAPETTTSGPAEHFVLSAHVPATPGQSGVLIDDPIIHSPVALITEPSIMGKFPPLWTQGQAILCSSRGMPLQTTDRFRRVWETQPKRRTEVLTSLAKGMSCSVMMLMGRRNRLPILVPSTLLL